MVSSWNKDSQVYHIIYETAPQVHNFWTVLDLAWMLGRLNILNEDNIILRDFKNAYMKIFYF